MSSCYLSVTLSKCCSPIVRMGDLPTPLPSQLGVSTARWVTVFETWLVDYHSQRRRRGGRGLGKRAGIKELGGRARGGVLLMDVFVWVCAACGFTNTGFVCAYLCFQIYK